MFSVQQVGKRILDFRKEKNMTQTELADELDVSFQAVSNWERGNSMPDISKLPQLADLFGCSLDELLGGKSELLRSAVNDGIQEYVENNDIPREELEAAVPVLKPDQLHSIAEGILLKNGDKIDLFYPFLDGDTLKELAERKIGQGESWSDMLPFLKSEYIRELALRQYEQGEEIIDCYPFLKKDDLIRLARMKCERGESIIDMLPFLDRDFLRTIILGA